MSTSEVTVYGDLPERTPRETVAQLRAAGWSLESFGAMKAVFESELAGREETGEMPCDAFRAGTLDLLERTFVQGQTVTHEDLQARVAAGQVSDQDVTDFRLGVHMGSCSDRACQLLGEVYWDLRNTAESEEADTAAFLAKLRGLYGIPGYDSADE